MVNWDETYDVIVIGSGLAGLCAAVEARTAGARVVVFEKMKISGGNTRISDGGLAAPNNFLQKRKDVADSAALFCRDILKAGHGLNHPDLVTAFAQEASTAVDWTRKELNVRYMDRLDQFGGHSAARCLTLKGRSGSDLIKALVAKLGNLGVEIRTDSLLKQIITGKENRVTGVKIDTRWRAGNEPDGGLKQIRAKKGVVLATGGYGGDVGFRSFLQPRLDDNFQTTNHRGATAEALIAALGANASALHLSRIQLLPSGCPDEKGYGKGGRFGSYLVYPHGILVNPVTGRRIVNEWADRKARADAMVQQQTPCIGLIDSLGAREAPQLVSQCLKSQKVQVFETIPDIADQFHMPRSALETTIRNYNTAIDQGTPDAFGKPLKSSTPKIVSPPFYAIRLWPKIHYTPGGVGINPRAQVLDFNQRPVPGLYAAGEVTGGVHGAGRLGSCALTECIVFGRIAGRQAGSSRPANSD